MPHHYQPDPGQGVTFSAILAVFWLLWAIIDFFTQQSSSDILLKVFFAIGSLAYMFYGIRQNKKAENAVREKLAKEKREERDSFPIFRDSEKKD